jgi:hypothetical protein
MRYIKIHDYSKPQAMRFKSVDEFLVVPNTPGPNTCTSDADIHICISLSRAGSSTKSRRGLQSWTVPTRH